MAKPSQASRPVKGGGKTGAARNMPAVRAGYYRGEQYRTGDSVGYLMKQVAEMLSRALDARMAEYSLTDAQWRPLLLLSRSGTDTATQVAQVIGCDAGATTRMLDRLEDKGLLRRVRSVNDRRVQQLELTDEGREAAQIVPYVIADVLNMHLADLSRAEVDTLHDLLLRIISTGRREAACAAGETRP